MTDPFLTLGRVTMLILVPLMLLFPIVFAALVPSRAATDSARIAVRGRLLALSLVTLVLLGLWVGLLITGLRFHGAMVIANFWWAWFIPLWFFLAWPTVALKRADWRSNFHEPASPGGSCQGAGDVRSASLVNRERKSPVTRAMWAVPVMLFVLLIAAIATRGLMPFGVRPYPGDSALDPAAARVVYAEAERSSWLLSLIVFGSVFGFLLAILPSSLRRTLSEPEPMDVSGSAELADLYQRQRRKRVLGLFWGCGTALPLFIGSFAALRVWFPSEGSLWGLAGGIGGSLLGICGAIFGTWMTVERARIAEVKARLEQASSIPH